MEFQSYTGTIQGTGTMLGTGILIESFLKGVPVVYPHCRGQRWHYLESGGTISTGTIGSPPLYRQRTDKSRFNQSVFRCCHSYDDRTRRVEKRVSF